MFNFMVSLYLVNSKSYMYECFAWMYVCAPLACLVPTEARESVESPATGVIVSSQFWNCCVGPRTLTLILRKNSQNFNLLNDLSSPYLLYYFFRNQFLENSTECIWIILALTLLRSTLDTQPTQLHAIFLLFKFMNLCCSNVLWV